MKLALTVNGAAHEIDLDHCDAQIIQPEPGVYSVLLGGRSYEARIEEADGRLVVWIGGHRFEIEVHDPRHWSRQSGSLRGEGRISVTAPMPGKIVRLLVAAGDTVEAGRGLIVVEAMKMQNEMKAPKAGRVVALTAREGATVAAGEVLATIE
jgi:biotin carboxyl carrier protein